MKMPGGTWHRVHNHVEVMVRGGRVLRRSTIIPGMVALAALTACKPSQEQSGLSISGSLSLVDLSALTSAYVNSFAPFEAAAANLRNNDPRYTIQANNWSFGGGPPSYDSYSLDNANVEYAHAVGLTGVGQLIAIVDAGFLTTHDEFTGKTITTPSGASAPGVDDHGTSVASIAAGAANFGNIIGVAPGADLHLGSFNTNASMTAAANQARNLGAIVQNNSWGYELTASDANYKAVFGSASGQTYINALKKLSKKSVIVFSASNNTGRSKADLMAGLPSLVSGLKPTWITAINAVPKYGGGKIKSASLISSGCLEAAAWCMAADGTVVAATAAGASNYGLMTGSSFSAPQISGAVALLAEAFPALSAKELRARLLASANNSFYKHTGYVKFAKGIKHGYNNTYGHGFLDLRAALLPIGGAFMPRASGRKVALSSPVVLSGGMAGNALSKRLARHNLIFIDGLGGGFQAPASILTAERRNYRNRGASLGTLMATDLNSKRADPFDNSSAFSSLIAGRELEVNLDATKVALLLPTGDFRSDSYGIAVSHAFDLGGSALSLGFQSMQEGDGFVGMKSLLPGERLNAVHNAATVELAIALVARQEIRIGGSLGIADPSGNMSTMSLSPVLYNSLKIGYGAHDVLGKGDRFSLGVNLPQVIHSGSASFNLPVTMSAGSPTFSDINIPLAPDGRQMDMTIGYGFPLSDRSEVVMSAVHSLNSGNVSGQTDTVAAIGWRLRF